MENAPLMTLTQVADALGMTYRAVRDSFRRGDLPLEPIYGLRASGMPMFRRSDVAKLIGQPVGAAVEPAHA